MDITIRPAQPEDAEQILSHVRRLLQEPGIKLPLELIELTVTVEQERQRIVEAFNSVSSVYLVAEACGQIIGEVSCRCGTRRAFSHAVTLGLSVDKAWRNKGVGNRLMTEMIAWAKNKSAITRIELYVYASNMPAIHLYEKFGFEIEGRRRRAVRQNGEFFDDLIMARLL